MDALYKRAPTLLPSSFSFFAEYNVYVRWTRKSSTGVRINGHPVPPHPTRIFFFKYFIHFSGRGRYSIYIRRAVSSWHFYNIYHQQEKGFARHFIILNWRVVRRGRETWCKTKLLKEMATVSTMEKRWRAYKWWLNHSGAFDELVMSQTIQQKSANSAYVRAFCYSAHSHRFLYSPLKFAKVKTPSPIHVKNKSTGLVIESFQPTETRLSVIDPILYIQFTTLSSSRCCCVSLVPPFFFLTLFLGNIIEIDGSV